MDSAQDNKRQPCLYQSQSVRPLDDEKCPEIQKEDTFEEILATKHQQAVETETEGNPCSMKRTHCPIVDRFSMTRYSPGDWRARNAALLKESGSNVAASRQNLVDCRQSMSASFNSVDQTQANSTQLLVKRCFDINQLKSTLERSINAMGEEIATLEEQRQRLKKTLATITVPEAIASECLNRRCGRPEMELVCDSVEEELAREITLIRNIRQMVQEALAEANYQQEANRSARERLEYDWSDKGEAFGIDHTNVGLHNQSTTILHKPGAARFPDKQSTEEDWAHFSYTSMLDGETCRLQSIRLRNTLEAMLLNTARDLRTQADAVDQALANRIRATDEARMRLENELIECLRQLADTERLIDKLTDGMRNLESAMKVCQTRLDSRNRRPRFENCRDISQLALVDEVHAIQCQITSLVDSLRQSEATKSRLMKMRGTLERDISSKRRALQVDRDRCLMIRSHFPSATALSGY